MTQKDGKHYLPDEALEMVAERFKALSEKTRLKLILALESGEKNVSELVRIVGANQANVSHQLQILLDAGIVARRKEGVNVYYRISEPNIFDLCECVCKSLKKQYEKNAIFSKIFDTV
ncbi:MAG: metalloregulator ArsR/SmtB family transcription factor [Verrucomicrobiae bacterium]|nr:metalloregulator ArsR/SmtB family transcription factor [Verrucomicrobiae bacterium]